VDEVAAEGRAAVSAAGQPGSGPPQRARVGQPAHRVRRRAGRAGRCGNRRRRRRDRGAGAAAAMVAEYARATLKTDKGQRKELLPETQTSRKMPSVKINSAALGGGISNERLPKEGINW